MGMKELILASSFAIGAITPGVLAEPFVFQGTLNDEGTPADGLFDLEFVIFGADIGGAQVGPTLTLEDQEVTQGNFLVELDFGDVFDGSQRWIEISVRIGESVGGFTELAPRLKVGSAPQASYASKAGVANTLADPFWTQAPGILFFGDDGGNDQFFFNRNRDVVPTDVMVVQANQNGMSGITLSTWANGMPYFGYATGGFMRTKTYYDPATDAWVVNKNGDQLEIDGNNDVVITNNLIVGGTITSLSGSEPTTGFKSFTPDVIFAGSSTSRFFHLTAGAIAAPFSSNFLRADFDLPHGSIIHSIRVDYIDGSVTINPRFELRKRSLSTMNFTTDFLAEPTGSNPGVVQTINIVPSSELVIDNTAYTYDFLMTPSTNFWPNAGQLGVRSILIDFTAP
ncbi:MAG: hypothetical protein JKX70_11935 [Phycisphaerales bacterium]|nr:hypothetical protein [Phycisphaerales bacterium]